MTTPYRLEVPIEGMDCNECAMHVEHALQNVAGISSVQVFLAAEKAVLQYDPEQVTMGDIRAAVQSAGYSVPAATDSAITRQQGFASQLGGFSRTLLTLLGVVFGAVLFVAVVGEWLGLFETITSKIPWYAGLAIVLIGGYPVFANVIRAALKKQVISHTLMAVGVLAAILVGQWVTAAVVVFFMRVGDYAEHLTTERARRAVKDLTALAPQTARIEQADGQEIEVPVEKIQVGDTVIVRPGDKIPVDGFVISGQATVDQATLTGEAMPVEAASGSQVYAATLARLGSLRVRATHIGRDTTFGHVIKMVEEAEVNRGPVQQLADRFSARYLPVVAGIALISFLFKHDPLASAAVLLVACSCSFALATPVAMLASIGAAAKQGILIKGGKYIEVLSKADVLLVDKTGTLTLGQPQITDVIALENRTETDIITLAASAERYSEHPLAGAVRRYAFQQQLNLLEPGHFEAIPGRGVQVLLAERTLAVGDRRMLPPGCSLPQADSLESQGKKVLFLIEDGSPIGILAAEDTLRPEVPAAFAEIRKFGIQKIELLTGDNARSAAKLANTLGIEYRADLLPEQKIAIVKEYQAQGKTVIMVGDGVNDAPALAQANVGIAMGAAGTDIAIEAAHVALMRDDWQLVPNLLQIARHTMAVVKTNFAFTAVYNLVGLSLAAFGFLPPILAAAAQSLPDIGIMANSSRLIRQAPVMKADPQLLQASKDLSGD